MTNDFPVGIATTEKDRDQMLDEEVKRHKYNYRTIFIRAYKYIPNKLSNGECDARRTVE